MLLCKMQKFSKEKKIVKMIPSIRFSLNHLLDSQDDIWRYDHLFLYFTSEIPPKDPCVKGLVPSLSYCLEAGESLGGRACWKEVMSLGIRP